MNRTARASALILGALALAVTDLSAGQFKPAVYYHAGSAPYQIAATHLTESGNLDLVMADYPSNQIVVLLGRGDGTFEAPMKFSLPNPVALAVGDFNGDGKEDLVVVEYGGTGESAIAILLGDGTGKFRQSSSYPSGVETTGVAVADFNGDGNQDVAVANNAGNVMVFFGSGKGTLRKPATYNLRGTNPYNLAAGDLNGDGHPDLAVAEAIGGSVAVLLNDGTGKFLKPVTYNAGGGEVVDVKIADLRNDGRNDLVIANGSAGMVVLLNKGNGTFGKATIYPPCSGSPPCEAPQAVVVADFNLDGRLDAAVATNIDNSYFYYGKGDGTFGLAIPVKDTIEFKGGYSIAAGDFITGNKAPDLAIPIEFDGKVAIMINTQ
jgi:hypothetical protein